MVIWIHRITNRDIRNGSDGYPHNEKQMVLRVERGTARPLLRHMRVRVPPVKVCIQPIHIPLISGSIHHIGGCFCFR